MGAILMGGILLGTLLLYAWFMFIWLSSRIASLIGMPFRKDADDEIVQYEGDMGMGRIVVTGVTRGDRRARYIALFVVWPVMIYFHYHYWNELYGIFKWFFEDLVAPMIASIL